MSLAWSVAEILREHVTLEVEGIDRMFLNMSCPGCCTRAEWPRSAGSTGGGQPVASSALMDRPHQQGVRGGDSHIRARARCATADVREGAPEDAVMVERLKQFAAPEGVVFIGVKGGLKRKCLCSGPRNETRRRGRPIPAWCGRRRWSTNSPSRGCRHWSVLPEVRHVLPLHRQAVLERPRQLTQRGIAYEAFDNGILSGGPAAGSGRVRWTGGGEDREFAHKWLRRLTHPFTATDQRTGYKYVLSILQAEFSLTQILDRPVTGRVFFEEVIRGNLGLAGPSGATDLRSAA